MTARTEEHRYVPAAGRDAFTRLYDPFMALTMREAAWRPDLVRAASDALPPDGTAADVAPAPAPSPLRSPRRGPMPPWSRLTATRALAFARQKPGAERVEWHEGLARQFALADESADVTTMALMLHHLVTDAKRAALAEARRVLRRAGSLLCDVLLPRRIEDAGFARLNLLRRLPTAFGSLERLAARRTA